MNKKEGVCAEIENMQSPHWQEENKGCEWVLGDWEGPAQAWEWVAKLQREMNRRTEESQELLVSAVNLGLWKLLGLLLPSAFNWK